MLSNIPRRVAHRFLRYALQYVQTRPRIKATAINLLANFPLITMRLKNLARTSTNKSLHKPRIKRHVLNSANSPIIHSDCQYAPTPLVAFPAKQGYRKIYYYVDHTILCPVNTGMQRVARRLGRALFDAGELVCFVKWDVQEHQMVLLNHDELAQLAKWNGPALSVKDKEPYPISDSHTVPVASHVPDEGHWLVVPEVTHITYQEQPMTLEILMGAKHLGLKTAFIFYDATPLRRDDLKEMASSHETYMQQLLLADLIIPISNWSARDLVSFFSTHEGATLTPTPRITALQLPG